LIIKVKMQKINYQFTLSFIAIILFFSTVQTRVVAQTDPAKPNILLIIADDLGVDASNRYQDSDVLPNTPNFLFDISGKQVAKTQLPKGSTTNTLGVQRLNNGHYILELKEGNHRSQHKVQIMKHD